MTKDEQITELRAMVVTLAEEVEDRIPVHYATTQLYDDNGKWQGFSYGPDRARYHREMRNVYAARQLLDRTALVCTGDDDGRG